MCEEWASENPSAEAKTRGEEVGGLACIALHISCIEECVLGEDMHFGFGGSSPSPLLGASSPFLETVARHETEAPPTTLARASQVRSSEALRRERGQRGRRRRKTNRPSPAGRIALQRHVHGHNPSYEDCKQPRCGGNGSRVHSFLTLYDNDHPQIARR